MLLRIEYLLIHVSIRSLSGQQSKTASAGFIERSFFP